MIRVLHITSGLQQCGIREYTQFLTQNLEQFENITAGHADDMIHALAHAPHLVHLQWGGGLFRGEDLQLVRQHCSAHGVPFLATVHNSALHALSFRPDKIIVHADADARELARHGYDSSQISFLHQGIPILPQLQVSAMHTFGLFGFLLPHKGFLETLTTFADFRNAYPEVGATMLISSSIHPHNLTLSQGLADQLTAKIAALGLGGCVELHLDFPAVPELAARLMRAKVLIYPYLHDANQSASAAVNLGIGTGNPCIISAIRLFEPIQQGVMRFWPGDWQSLKAAMFNILQPHTYAKLKAELTELRQQNSWPRIATKVANIYQDMLRQGRPRPMRRAILLSANGNVPLSFSHVQAELGKALMNQGLAVVQVEQLAAQHAVELPWNMRLDHLDAEVKFSWPLNFQYRQGGHVKAQFVCWETTRYPTHWLEQLRQVHRVITFSQFSEDVLLQSGLERGRLVRMSLGVNLDCFKPEGEHFDWKVHVPGGLPSDRPVIFFHMGALDDRKGTQILLHAYLKAFSRHDNVLLAIKNNSFMNISDVITAEVGNRANTARICIIQSEIASQVVAQMMRSVTVGVFPYLAEGGFGLVPLETMACGTPCIVSAFGAPPEYVNADNGFLLSGRLVQSGFLREYHQEHPEAQWFMPDIEQLTALLQMIYRDPSIVRRKSANARATACQFTWERAAQQLITALFA